MHLLPLYAYLQTDVRLCGSHTSHSKKKIQLYIPTLWGPHSSCYNRNPVSHSGDIQINLDYILSIAAKECQDFFAFLFDPFRSLLSLLPLKLPSYLSLRVAKTTDPTANHEPGCALTRSTPTCPDFSVSGENAWSGRGDWVRVPAPKTKMRKRR